MILGWPSENLFPENSFGKIPQKKIKKIPGSTFEKNVAGLRASPSPTSAAAVVRAPPSTLPRTPRNRTRDDGTMACSDGWIWVFRDGPKVDKKNNLIFL